MPSEEELRLTKTLRATKGKEQLEMLDELTALAESAIQESNQRQ